MGPSGRAWALDPELRPLAEYQNSREPCQGIHDGLALVGGEVWRLEAP